MIKSKLLASTMLVSAAALVSAGNANAMDLKLGGFLELWVGGGDQDKTFTRDNGFDVKTDSEIHFKAEETLDNGIKVGARLEMEAGNGHDGAGGAQGVTGFDETFGWMKTKWGQVNIGNNDVAAAYTGGVSVVGPVGITKSDAGDWIPGADTGLNDTDIDIGVGDAANVTYFTPKVAGVQVIVSYTPDSSDGGSSDYDDNENGGFHDAWSGAVKYGGKFGGVSLGLSAGYTNVDLATDALGSGDPEHDTGTGYGTTAKVGFGPVLLSATYAKENFLDEKARYWAMAALYRMGNNAVSIGYTENSTYGIVPEAGSEDSELWTIGFEHKLGKGASLAASVFGAESNDTSATTNAKKDAWGAAGGLRISF